MTTPNPSQEDHLTTPTFWTPALGLSRDFVRRAVTAEEQGWDGVLALESPKATPDPFIDMALAARETSRIRFGTGVAIPVPRIAIALANAAAVVQDVSDGRCVIGLGRGDSGQAHLGMAPVPVPRFERYLRRVRAYLRGESVPHDLDLDGCGGAIPPAQALEMVDYPETSRLAWLPEHLPTVPVTVAVTGPRMTRLAARHADGALLAVGAEPSRLAAAIETIRTVRDQAGLSREPFSIGAFLSVVPDEDRDRGRRMASGNVASFARFSSMQGTVPSTVGTGDKAIYQALHDSYTMRGHMRDGSPQSTHLTDEFIDRFAIVGPPEECAARLAQLVDLGVDRVICLGPGFGHDADEIRHRIATQVLPAVRKTRSAARSAG